MIHIIGASGTIGTKLVEFFNSRSFFDYLSYSDIDSKQFKKLDLTNFTGVHTNEIRKNDIIVLLAAISSPDICQNNYKLAHEVNFVGTSKFIDECIGKSAKIIFISSDVVYGSSNLFFDENSVCNPIGNYAILKNSIEIKYTGYMDFKALRLSYVLSENDRFIKYIEECNSKNTTPSVFNGLFRNIVLIEDVVEAIYNLAINFSTFSEGIINVCGTKCLSRSDLAEYYTKNIKLIKYNVIDVPKEILESRPNKIETKSLYLEKLLGRKPKNIL